MACWELFSIVLEYSIFWQEIGLYSIGNCVHRDKIRICSELTLSHGTICDQKLCLMLNDMAYPHRNSIHIYLPSLSYLFFKELLKI